MSFFVQERLDREVRTLDFLVESRLNLLNSRKKYRIFFGNPQFIRNFANENIQIAFTQDVGEN